MSRADEPIEVPPAVVRALSAGSLGIDGELTHTGDLLAVEQLAAALAGDGSQEAMRAAMAELPTIDRATIGEWLVQMLMEVTWGDRPSDWAYDDELFAERMWIAHQTRNTVEGLVGQW